MVIDISGGDGGGQEIIRDDARGWILLSDAIFVLHIDLPDKSWFSYHYSKKKLKLSPLVKKQEQRSGFRVLELADILMIVTHKVRYDQVVSQPLACECCCNMLPSET